jgi:hypothetical protein
MYGLFTLGKTFGTLTNMSTAILLGGKKTDQVVKQKTRKKEVCFLCKPKNNDKTILSHQKPLVQRKLQESV